MHITLTVNGTPATVDVPADMPLLWVLRDVLNLRGTKYGCGIGACGACTVHLASQPARSCQTKVAEVRNRTITTIEGLSPDGTTRSSGRGRRSTSRNAATARPARS